MASRSVQFTENPVGYKQAPTTFVLFTSCDIVFTDSNGFDIPPRSHFPRYQDHNFPGSYGPTYQTLPLDQIAMLPAQSTTMWQWDIQDDLRQTSVTAPMTSPADPIISPYALDGSYPVFSAQPGGIYQPQVSPTAVSNVPEVLE